MNVLVTGACGYIGSHAVKCLGKAGHRAVALDNLSRGHREALDPGVPFVELDVRNTEAVASALRTYAIDCVLHFAAFAYVGESVEQPLLYYDNNTRGTLSLLSAVERAGVKRLVFSSTCATYGEPATMPIREDTPQSPINPYGWSKLFSERMLRDYAARTPDFSFAALRYFNVAGCAADGSLGEHHEPETHLIPVVLQAALGKRDKITIFGDDYPTPDGTGVRDYGLRRRSGGRARARDAGPPAGAASDLQPRHRARHQLQGDRGRGTQGRRATVPRRGRSASARRSAVALRGREPDRARARLESPNHRHSRGHRQRLALVRAAPERLRQSSLALGT